MRKKGKESYRKACVVFNGQKEFTKRETIGEKWRYKVYLFFPAREERERGWKKGQLAKKRRRKGGEKTIATKSRKMNGSIFR